MLWVEWKNGMDQLALLADPIFLLTTFGATDLHVYVLHAQAEATKDDAEEEKDQYDENQKCHNDDGR